MGTYSTYTIMDEMLASATQPLASADREAHIGRMWEGLHALGKGAGSRRDLIVCLDALAIMEVLVALGECQDPGGLIFDAIDVVKRCEHAAQVSPAPLYALDPDGVLVVRGVLEDYQTVLTELPCKLMIKAHRLAERSANIKPRARGKSKNTASQRSKVAALYAGVI